jgi:hypothetical protein
VDEFHDSEVSPASFTETLICTYHLCSHLKLHYMESEYGLTELAHLGSDADLLLPLEVDDDFITEDEVLPQAPGRLSLVAGLNALTAINKTWMDSAITTPSTPLHCHYSDATSDSGNRLGTCECGREVHLAGPLAVARKRLRRLERCLDNLPQELAAEAFSESSRNRPQVSAILQSQYDLMRANVHVTHLWAQNHLLELIIALSAESMHGDDSMQVKEHCFESQKIVARKMLSFLNTVPKFDLLPNGLVLVSSSSSVFRRDDLLTCTTEYQDSFRWRKPSARKITIGSNKRQ